MFFPKTDTLAAYESVDACISAMMALSSYVTNGFYLNVASETRSGITKKLKSLSSRNIYYIGGCGGISTDVLTSKKETSKLSVYPNPASQLAIISYQLAENSSVEFSVCDLLGKEAMQVVNEKQSSGEHQLSLNTEQLQNGIYFVKMIINREQVTQKLIINK